MGEPCFREAFAVVYVGFFDLSEDDGKSINEREFVRALLQLKNVDAIYIGPKTKKRLDLPKSKFLPLCQLNRSFRSQMIYQIRLAIQLFRMLREYRGRIVICTRPNYAAVFPALFTKTTNRPLIVKYAGLSIPLIEERKDLSIVHRKIAKFVYSMNACLADRIWVVTDQIGDYWHKNHAIPKSKMFVLSNGTDTRRFHPGRKQALPQRVMRMIPSARIYVGYAGGLRKILGIHLLMEVADRFRRDGEDIVFLIAGRGPDEEALRRRVADQGLRDRFVLLGHLSYHDMPAFYDHCHVMVAPFTQSFINRFGSSSQKIYQYLACGKPVVVTRAPDHAFIEEEVLGKLAFIEDAAEFGQAILKVLEEEEAADKSRRRYRYVRRHKSYPVIASEFLQNASLVCSSR